jgi:hypothetical protein
MSFQAIVPKITSSLSKRTRRRLCRNFASCSALFLMQSRKTHPWSAEDDQLIRSLVAKGVSAFRAGVALKRNRNAVMKRARDLGCAFPTLTQEREAQRRREAAEL